jgi:hypothetical protein
MAGAVRALLQVVECNGDPMLVRIRVVKTRTRWQVHGAARTGPQPISTRAEAVSDCLRKTSAGMGPACTMAVIDATSLHVSGAGRNWELLKSGEVAMLALKFTHVYRALRSCFSCRSIQRRQALFRLPSKSQCEHVRERLPFSDAERSAAFLSLALLYHG